MVRRTGQDEDGGGIICFVWRISGLDEEAINVQDVTPCPDGAGSGRRD